MPLFHTRQEIAGISGLLSAMQLLPDSLAALADIDFASLERLYLVGSGDSYAIALMVEEYLNRCGTIQCRAVQSLAFLGIPVERFSATSLVVVISASGRPSPVLDALAHALAKTQQDGLRRLSVRPLADCAEAHDILINCTPVGMYPHVDACPVSADVIARCGAVFDAVYNPRETRLLALAKQNGLPTIEGLGMLFYQAVEAQKFWFGDRVASKAEQSRIYSELQTRL